jgi:hypothetical protein
MSASFPKSIGKDSPLQKALIFWAGSLILALAAFFMGAMLNDLAEAIQSPSTWTQKSPTPTPATIRNLWMLMAGDGTDSWNALGILLALALLPVTFFISTVLAENPFPINSWSQAARDTALNLLFWVSLLVATTSWLFLPVVLHSSTALIGIPLILGIGFTSGVLAVFSISQTSLKETLRRNQKSLKSLKKGEKVLRKQTSAYLDKANSRSRARLSKNGHKFLFYKWLTLSGLVLIPTLALTMLEILISPASFSKFWPLYLVTLLVVLFDGVLGCFYSLSLSEFIKNRKPGLSIIILWNLLLLLMAITAFVSYGWTPASIHFLLGLFAIPLITCVTLMRKGSTWFVYYRWLAIKTAISRCKKYATRTNETLKSMKTNHRK